MKYVDEYRSAEDVLKYSEALKKITTKEWILMEVCGGQTNAIVRFGIQDLLPEKINLVHGPGCPVCVTPVEMVDKAIAIAGEENVIFCSFGDMLRVPGSKRDLLSMRAEGGDIRILYSPVDAIKIAVDNPDKQVVFFAVGFETTAPANAMAVHMAKQQGLKNFSVLVSHVLVPPAIESIMSSPQNKVQAFLAAGHVCAVMGYEEYTPLAKEHNVPIVVTGFEPLDIMQGIYMLVKQLEEGRHEVENQYLRAVNEEGNTAAKDLLQKVFKVIPRKWRGIGEIPKSGWGLSDEYSEFDAEIKFANVTSFSTEEDSECISGEILLGIKKPNQCPAFGKRCTPEKPLGATMVSDEGACSAYYNYKKDAA